MTGSASASLSSSALRASSVRSAVHATKVMTAVATSKASSPPPTSTGNGKRVRDHAEDAPESHGPPPTKKVYDMFAPKASSAGAEISAAAVASTSSQIPSAVAPGDPSVLHKKRQCSESPSGAALNALSQATGADWELPSPPGPLVHRGH